MNTPWWIIPTLCGLSAVGYILKLRGETKIKEQFGEGTNPHYTPKERKQFCQDFKQWHDINVQHSPNDDSQIWVFESTMSSDVYPLGHRIIATSQDDMITSLMIYHDKFMEDL